MDHSPRLYRVTAVGAEFCLRQGEILSNLVQLRLDLSTLGTDSLKVVPFMHPFAVILTQDCDLEQHHQARQGQVAQDKLLPSILFCEAATAEQLYGGIKQTNRKLWDRIRINKDERYQFFQGTDPACDTLQLGVPELGIDFKKYFTIPTEEVYQRLALGEAQRRTVMVSPYLEHFSSRFAYFLSRIALPAEHASE